MSQQPLQFLLVLSVLVNCVNSLDIYIAFVVSVALSKLTTQGFNFFLCKIMDWNVKVSAPYLLLGDLKSEVEIHGDV